MCSIDQLTVQQVKKKTANKNIITSGNEYTIKTVIKCLIILSFLL